MLHAVLPWLARLALGLPLPGRATTRRGPGSALDDAIGAAFATAIDGMVVYDRHHRVVTWNRAYQEMFRLPADVLRPDVTMEDLVRHMALRGIYGDGVLDELVEARLRILREPTGGVRMHYAPFGRVLDMRSVRLPDGGLFFTFYDATAQAKSAVELEAERAILERRVRERTEQLEQLNYELVQAKAEAEDANISKTRFLAAASHDLLQPLNAARLYSTSLCERLRANEQQSEPARLAANVDASLEAVEDILGALLEITQLDAGATRVEIDDVPLERVFRQLAVDFAPMAAKRHLRLTFVASSLVVRTDRRLLRRLMQNLVSNALKYTIDGGVVVGARRLGDGTARLDVVDTGVGILAGKQLLIFREFERLPSSIEDVPGAGLGLSIVDRLSHVLGHEVTLESHVGRGSRFSVAVPRAVGVAWRRPAPPSTVTRQRSLAGLVVAAIDNEASVLDGMEAMLRGWDCEVATGTDLDAVEARLATLGRRPDVVIADFHIGGVNGLDVVAALRRRHGALPAVLITADRSTAVRVLAGDADVRVMMKPLKPAALRSLLSQWNLLRVGAV